MKICIVTGTRAEYGLFLPLLSKIKQEPKYELQLVVTGMHLSAEFGMTYKDIEKDGFVINEKVENLLSSDTNVGITKSTGLGMIGFADAFQRLKPHWVFLLGDRFETFAAATAAYLAKIPIAHLHGGETTEGATDEGLRHAITKMSYLHFASTEAYRKRIIQLGEAPERIFNVGAIGLDNIQQLEFLSKEALSETLDFDITSPYVLVTFHPVTLENETAENQFNSLLKAFDRFSNLKIIFTLPNADANGRIIIKLINDYVSNNKERAKAFSSLGQLRYLSAIKYAKAVIGNSSSGIIEAPTLRIPTINIGDRQKGRLRSKTVIDVAPYTAAIIAAIQKSLSVKFQNECLKSQNPYGKGDTTEKIMEVLSKQTFGFSLKKPFFDLKPY